MQPIQIAMQCKLMTAEEVAALLRVHATTFCRMRSQGLILDPVIDRARARRWLASEVEEWVAAGTPPAKVWSRIKAAKK